MLYKSIEKAKNKAREVIKEHNINPLEEVEVEKIAKEIGVKIKRTNLNSNTSGLLKITGAENKPVIAVNKIDSRKRQRFTIAHELGHYLLHTADMIFVDDSVEKVHFRDEKSSEASDIKEIEANQFAAELLMPEQSLTKKLKSKYGNSLDLGSHKISEVVEDLSEDYGVSKTAMTIKLGKVIDF